MSILDYILAFSAVAVLAIYIYLGFKKPGIALITSPLVGIVMAVAGAANESVVVLAVAPITFVATLLAIVISQRESDFQQWPRTWAKGILGTLAVLAVVVFAGFVCGPAAIYGIVFLAVVIGFFIGYGIVSRQATAAYVLSTIGSSMRQNLPLPMALETAAGGQNNTQAKIFMRIKKWLVQGYSLSESIKRGYPKCPGHAVGLIAAAERINQLPLALSSIEADIIAKTDERKKVRPLHPLYPVLLMLFVFFMVWGLLTFVIPRFYAVISEMTEGQGQLPAATRLLVLIAKFVRYEYGWVWFVCILVVVCISVLAGIRIKFRPRRPDKPYLFSRMGDFVKWHLPILHWFENNYSMVQVVELLRLSLNSGCTVNDAIANTLTLDVNNCFKKRLKRWLGKVEAGRNISLAAKESGLGNSLAWAFDQINHADTLGILEMLESFYRSNYGYHVNIARFILWPCVSIGMGIVVGFVVYAVFSPGIVIIKNLADMVTP